MCRERTRGRHSRFQYIRRCCTARSWRLIQLALANIARSDEWGSLVFGGPLVTAGGLVFVAASQDDRFRAFDIDTGELLWEYALPAGGQASPMTYRYKGRQYIVIAAGGRAGIGSPGDWIVAFARPEE